jgi:hypothetical protein
MLDANPEAEAEAPDADGVLPDVEDAPEKKARAKR